MDSVFMAGVWDYTGSGRLQLPIHHIFTSPVDGLYEQRHLRYFTHHLAEKIRAELGIEPSQIVDPEWERWGEHPVKLKVPWIGYDDLLDVVDESEVKTATHHPVNEERLRELGLFFVPEIPIVVSSEAKKIYIREATSIHVYPNPYMASLICSYEKSRPSRRYARPEGADLTMLFGQLTEEQLELLKQFEGQEFDSASPAINIEKFLLPQGNS